MILQYYNVNPDIYSNCDEESDIFYEVFCPNCNGDEIIDIDDESEWIDGLEIVSITFKCKNCGKEWIESETKLSIFQC